MQGAVADSFRHSGFDSLQKHLGPDHNWKDVKQLMLGRSKLPNFVVYEDLAPVHANDRPADVTTGLRGCAYHSFHHGIPLGFFPKTDRDDDYVMTILPGYTKGGRAHELVNSEELPFSFMHAKPNGPPPPGTPVKNLLRMELDNFPPDVFPVYDVRFTKNIHRAVATRGTLDRAAEPKIFVMYHAVKAVRAESLAARFLHGQRHPSIPSNPFQGLTFGHELHVLSEKTLQAAIAWLFEQRDMLHAAKPAKKRTRTPRNTASSMVGPGRTGVTGKLASARLGNGDGPGDTTSSIESSMKPPNTHHPSAPRVMMSSEKAFPTGEAVAFDLGVDATSTPCQEFVIGKANPCKVWCRNGANRMVATR